MLKKQRLSRAQVNSVRMPLEATSYSSGSSEKGCFMKNSLIILTIIVLISMSTVGCSTVRLIQTRAGYEVEKTVGNTEERQTQLSHRDFRLGFSATGDRLGIRLEYQPHYSIEKQQLVTYKPGGMRIFESLIGVSYLGLLGWVVYDNLNETGEIEVDDVGVLFNNITEFNWYRTTPSQKAIIVGVSLDFILWASYAARYKATVHEPWKKVGEVPGNWELLANHPYRIELPTYNFGKDYQSKTGDESVQISEFLAGIKDPDRFKEIDTVSLWASTEFDGTLHKENATLTTQAQLQPFYDSALVALDIDMISTGKPRLMPRAEAVARWNKVPVRAGDEATLKVTVENTGKGTLYRFTALTVSTNRTFNNHELKFGKIEPGESRTVPISFQLDKLIRTQEIPIRIRFGEYNDHVPENIDVKLKVIEIPRPKFDYAYRIIDGGTATSVGNGDGILQKGESADVLVTIRNSGEGNAEGVTARLNLLDRAGVDMYGDTSVNLRNLAAGDAKIATFNVGVKRGASISKLRLNLVVQEDNFGSETELTNTFNFPIGQTAVSKIKVMDTVGTVTSNSAQVYNGAASSTPVIAEIPRDSQARISGQLGEWYRVGLTVRDQELTGWIHEAQLTTAGSSKQQSAQVEKPTVVEVFQNTPPTLELLVPEQGDIEVEDSPLLIQAQAVANKGIKRIELIVNGKLVNVGGHGINTAQGIPPTVFKIEENVPLNYGLNTIRLNAFDTNDQASEPIALSVTRKPEEVRNDYALLFGVNSYEHFDPWHKLTRPIPDAEAIGNELKKRYGFAVEFVKDPTRDEILTKINQYVQKQYNENDQLLIFFAGHGYYEERNNTGIGYLVASNTLPPEADHGKSSYISQGDLHKRIENIGCEHIFLIVDACLSGAFDVPIDQFNRERDTEGISDDISGSKFIKQTLAYKTRWYLTSGVKAYVSNSRPNQHSPFVQRVLEALQSNSGQDGILTLDDICRYAERVTPLPRVGEFGTNALGSNFLFIRK
ncbi:hypothetical protein C6503_05450 [Candidatus Poribacteria bacterium]|nr:MAG: hypothetical protein C6503_05450 [Candidatus Poribacteria bacterium]